MSLHFKGCMAPVSAILATIFLGQNANFTLRIKKLFLYQFTLFPSLDESLNYSEELWTSEIIYIDLPHFWYSLK